MDPFTAAAALIYVFGRIGVWINKNEKKDEHEQTRGERLQIAEKYAVSSQAMVELLEQLSQQRLGYTSTLLKRIARSAAKLEPYRRPFCPEDGWFAGKSYDEVIALVERSDAVLKRTVDAIDEKVSLAMLSVVALQGI